MIGVWLAMFFAPPPAELAELIRKIAASGQVAEIAATPQERLSPAVRISPGPPPLLRFRGLEGQVRHRFGDLDLVVDDAGH